MMTITRFTLALLIAAISAQAASAFTVDDTTMGTPQAAQRFSDPDEKMPAGGFSITPSASYNQVSGFGNSASGSYGSTAAPFSGVTPVQGDVMLHNHQ